MTLNGRTALYCTNDAHFRAHQGNFEGDIFSHFYARQLYRQVLLRARISYGDSQGRSDGGISVYIPPNQSTLNFLCGSFVSLTQDKLKLQWLVNIYTHPNQIPGYASGDSVCPSVRPSVTTRYGFQAKWDRDSGSSPYDSLESLVSYEAIWCHWVRKFPLNEGIKEGYPLRNHYFTPICYCRPI